MGSNASKVSGAALEKGDVKKISHGDSIELLCGLYKHSVHFDPPPLKKKPEESQLASSKRMSDQPLNRGSEKAAKMSLTSAAKKLVMESLKGAAKSPFTKGNAPICAWQKSSKGEVYVMTCEECKPKTKVRISDSAVS